MKAIELTDKEANSCTSQYPYINFLTDLCHSNLGQESRFDMGSMNFLDQKVISRPVEPIKQTHDNFPVICGERFRSH